MRRLLGCLAPQPAPTQKHWSANGVLDVRWRGATIAYAFVGPAGSATTTTRAGRKKIRPEPAIEHELRTWLDGRSSRPSCQEFVAGGNRDLYTAASRNRGMARWRRSLGVCFVSTAAASCQPLRPHRRRGTCKSSVRRELPPYQRGKWTRQLTITAFGLASAFTRRSAARASRSPVEPSWRGTSAGAASSPAGTNGCAS